MVSSVLLLLLVAAGLTLGLRPSGGGPTSGFSINEPSTRVGALAVPIPPDFHRYIFRVGDHRTGTQPTIVGVLITDYRLPHSPQDVLSNWARLSSNGPPANRVALAVHIYDPIGIAARGQLHLPLALNQPWNQEHLRNGARGYRWGILGFHGQYSVLFWSGRNAPPRDRAAVIKILASIHPAQ